MFCQVELDEEFKFDHDLCFNVLYDEPFSPQVIVENGRPEAGTVTIYNALHGADLFK